MRVTRASRLTSVTRAHRPPAPKDRAHSEGSCTFADPACEAQSLCARAHVDGESPRPRPPNALVLASYDSNTMKKQRMGVVLLVLVSACGSQTNHRDAAVEAGYPGSGGTVSSTNTGSGGATVVGAGGATVPGTGGATIAGTGGTSTGGVSSAGGSAGKGGSGGMGTMPDGALPTADSGIDASAGTVDVAITSCEKSGGTCVETIGGCAICPPGSEPVSTRSGCATNAWCCTQAATYPSNQCTQNGGMCLMPGACPDGWVSMRSSCDEGGPGCCAPNSLACRNARAQLDGGATPDAVVLPPP
jgi:hypothetical protein